MRNTKSIFIVLCALISAITTAGINGSALAEDTKPGSYISNEECLECHDAILEWSTRGKNILQPHRLHLESKRTEYNGRQKMCVTCHEAMRRTEEGKGILEGDIYHPDTVMKPDGVWKKYIVRKDVASGSTYLDAVHPANPYTFKPLLQRLVCVDCHGPDSKVKILYGGSIK